MSKELGEQLVHANQLRSGNLGAITRDQRIEKLARQLRTCGYPETTIAGVCRTAQHIDCFEYEGEFYDIRPRRVRE